MNLIVVEKKEPTFDEAKSRTKQSIQTIRYTEMKDSNYFSRIYNYDYEPKYDKIFISCVQLREERLISYNELVV